MVSQDASEPILLPIIGHNNYSIIAVMCGYVLSRTFDIERTSIFIFSCCIRLVT